MKPATKSLNLPKPVAGYFTADKGDGEAVSQCFIGNAVVKDEGHTRSGLRKRRSVTTASWPQPGRGCRGFPVCPSRNRGHRTRRPSLAGRVGISFS